MVKGEGSCLEIFLFDFSIRALLQFSHVLCVSSLSRALQLFHFPSLNGDHSRCNKSRKEGRKPALEKIPWPSRSANGCETERFPLHNERKKKKKRTLHGSTSWSFKLFFYDLVVWGVSLSLSSSTLLSLNLASFSSTSFFSWDRWKWANSKLSECKK